MAAWGVLIGLGSMVLNWTAAQDAEAAQQQHYTWQRQMAQNAINELKADQALWDSVVPDLQEKLIRYTTGTWTAAEEQARNKAITDRAAPTITQAAASLNQQAQTAKESLTSTLGARGLTQHAPGMVARGLSSLESARIGATGAATAGALSAATTSQDDLAVRGLSSSLDRYGRRPSAASGYSAAANMQGPKGPVGVDSKLLGDLIGSGDLDKGIEEIWGWARKTFGGEEE